MANSKVSALPASSALAGTELFYSDNGVADVQVTANQIKDFTASASAASAAAAAASATLAATPDLDYAADLTGTSLTINAANAATYKGKMLPTTSNSAVTVTYGSDLGLGFNMGIEQVGTGQVTVASPLTVKNVDGETKTFGQNAVIGVFLGLDTDRATKVIVVTGRTGT